MIGCEEWTTRNCAKNWNFGYTTKWYMSKQESVLENQTRKILWDFDKQTEDQSREMENCRILDFAIPADHRVKIEGSKVGTSI